MRKIENYLYGVTLNELFAKSLENEVSITLGNHSPFEGKVVDISDGMVGIEDKSYKRNYIKIDDIDELYIYDE